MGTEPGSQKGADVVTQAPVSLCSFLMLLAFLMLILLLLLMLLFSCCCGLTTSEIHFGLF